MAQLLADKVILMHAEIFRFLHLFKVKNEGMVLLQQKRSKTINNRLWLQSNEKWVQTHKTLYKTQIL